MIPWKLFYLGSTTFMLPAAAAIAAWLAVARGWRIATRWLLFFVLGLSMIAVSKMAFAGWGVGIPALGFKAMSGHAMLTMGVTPVGLYLLLDGRSPTVRSLGAVLGVAFSLVMGGCLAIYDFHSMSEIIAGALVGGAVSFGFIRTQSGRPGQRMNAGLLVAGMLVFVLVWQLKPASLERSMMMLTLHLSGNREPFTTWASSP